MHGQSEDAETRRGRALEGVGFTHAMARIYAAVTLAPGEGLSSSELASVVGMSKATVSTSTQLLVGTGLLERYRVPGSRETHYRILKEAWGPLLAKKFTLMTAITRTVDEALRYTDSTPARERLGQMRDAYAFFEQEFATILQHWDERERS
jgi:DNA-binding transcriptional regulator GbsR (MarR family)